jgi:hypothetical protein
VIQELGGHRENLEFKVLLEQQARVVQRGQEELLVLEESRGLKETRGLGVFKEIQDLGVFKDQLGIKEFGVFRETLELLVLRGQQETLEFVDHRGTRGLEDF